MWPGEGGDVLLELQDRQEGFSAAPLGSKSGSRQNLVVFQFDAVVEGQPQPSTQQDVD